MYLAPFEYGGTAVQLYTDSVHGPPRTTRESSRAARHRATRTCLAQPHHAVMVKHTAHVKMSDVDTQYPSRQLPLPRGVPEGEYTVQGSSLKINVKGSRVCLLGLLLRDDP